MNVEKLQVVAEEPPRLISLAEAADILSISYPTAVRLVKSGELKAFKIRRAWRTSTGICEEFIRDGLRAQELACQREKTEG